MTATPVDPRTRTATDPFVFFGCVELRQALDKTAVDERELMERLDHCRWPPMVPHQGTCRP
jgi:hypothetical protein